MGLSQESPEGKEKVSSEASSRYRGPCRSLLREDASVHRTEEVSKVQKGFSRTDAGREGNTATLPWNTGTGEGRDVKGLESKAGGRGNPGTQAQRWWGSPQH